MQRQVPAGKQSISNGTTMVSSKAANQPESQMSLQALMTLRADHVRMAQCCAHTALLHWTLATVYVVRSIMSMLHNLQCNRSAMPEPYGKHKRHQVGSERKVTAYVRSSTSRISTFVQDNVTRKQQLLQSTFVHSSKHALTYWLCYLECTQSIGCRSSNSHGNKLAARLDLHPV